MSSTPAVFIFKHQPARFPSVCSRGGWRKGGLNSLGLHIERRHHPDNARADLSHLNRYDIVKLPPGCKTIAEAVEYRIAHAGLSRKVGKNQVRCLTAVMSSDHDKMNEIIRDGKFENWISDSVRWAQDKFGKENVVGAVLHMDETTRLTGKAFPKVKIMVDIALTATAVRLGFIYFHTWVWEVVGPGTLFAMVYVGAVVKAITPRIG